MLLEASFALAMLANAAAHAGDAHQAPPAQASETAKLGRNVDAVELTDADGGRLKWGALKGRPRAVFFGFTHCPVICPVTVWEIDNALTKIGPAAAKVQINFVSLDPARDTPQVMRDYFSSFKPRMRAVTGSPKAIADLAKAFEVEFEKVKLDNGDYTIDHTAGVFLVDERGQVVDVVAHGAPQDVMVARLKRLVHAP